MVEELRNHDCHLSKDDSCETCGMIMRADYEELVSYFDSLLSKEIEKIENNYEVHDIDPEYLYDSRDKRINSAWLNVITKYGKEMQFDLPTYLHPLFLSWIK